MSSAEITLRQMLEDVKNHQRSQASLLPKYVEKRLEKSLQTYYKQLSASFSSLSGYNEENVLKKLAKTNKQETKRN